MNQRRRSGQNFQELMNKDWSILTKNQHNELQNCFKRTEQRHGGISFYDMINILKSIGFQISQKKKDQINQHIYVKQIRVIDINILINIAVSLKKQRDENSGYQGKEQSQYLDSFIALGGATDKSGYLRKQNLIQIMKRQFQINFDADNIIEGMQGQSIDYQAFCDIFEKKGQDRLGSSVSKRTVKSQESVKSLELDDRDFHKFVSQYQDS